MLSRIFGTHLRSSAASSALRFGRLSPCGLRGSLAGSNSGSGSSSSDIQSVVAASPFLVNSKRFIQFEQSSDTLLGVNKNKRSMHHRWVTKSTKEYMSEADSKVSKGNSLLFSAREHRRGGMERKRERLREVTEESDRTFELELDRMREDKERRWKKGFNFFKRQGKAFTLLYLVAYVAPLTVLYVGFASGLLPKDAAFEFLFFFLQSFMDRDMFFERIEAWDTYTNFGFAFVVNETLEFLRFPLVMFFFYQTRPYLTGVNHRVKASIFRFNAAES
ncbi:conserved hypothetical protein [Leishmania braziliensis MHOM/BR/75/M2904]|uniref:Uncharacterized protein n=2 Tax=Leishmania braziliensis TaxID=5660 RepID=A4HLT4_LEIBR|nr:conserved hypothetical protein [Leishmania braziliensis MHOM/BR/75/M2904]KAI5687068.1 hypothetical protein MNV84_07112 [Leishmania braziliensis]CAJ2479582.1 unnamed protein product [Leishmania braziliensis]CAJ2479942.1 unnamed protein product [Leishmania braziliensis]CAM40780.1 conserved hypothetical protein [Leishmania braziliensis MHOM/BR/75/M2904]SYZ69191.1 hypothetical_protein [Leishmania braziliensis MHOM/BR/75/M2904]